jgi:hypothetical protein
VKCFEIATYGKLQNVTSKSKKNDTADNLLLKDRKKKNEKMNSQRTKQHICKPHKPTQNQSLQKSCFFADAPAELSIFGFINY